MLDTNAVAAALRLLPSVERKLDALAPEHWCISVITRAEILYGLALKPEATRLQRVARAFLQSARTLDWDRAAADQYASLRAELRKLGAPIGPLDEMLGAHCLSVGGTLVTDNTRHFSRIAGLEIENWLRS